MLWPWPFFFSCDYYFVEFLVCAIPTYSSFVFLFYLDLSLFLCNLEKKNMKKSYLIDDFGNLNTNGFGNISIEFDW